MGPLPGLNRMYLTRRRCAINCGYSNDRSNNFCNNARFGKCRVEEDERVKSARPWHSKNYRRHGENNNFGLDGRDQGHLRVSSFDPSKVAFTREKGQFLPSFIRAHAEPFNSLGLCKYNFEAGRISRPLPAPSFRATFLSFVLEIPAQFARKHQQYRERIL